MTCQRCADASAEFIRQHLWTCAECAAKLDARAEVQAAWTATAHRARRTFTQVFKAWEAR
jgi:ribosomal protein L37AE/L43A